MVSRLVAPHGVLTLLTNTLYHLGFTSSLADPYVGYKTSIKPDGTEYYQYVLVYVDDLLVLSHDPEKNHEVIEAFYRLKDGYTKLDRYLGAEVKQWCFPENSYKTVWALSSRQYVKEAVRTVESHLQKQNRGLPKVNQPLPSDYSPELDISPVLNDDDTNLYQSYVCVLLWILELGSLDIYAPVAFLSSFLTNPRVGHLEAVYQIFGYLKRHDKSTMVFDNTYIHFRDSDFPTYDWSEFNRGATEDLPLYMPPPRGQLVQMNVFIVSSHARNKLNSRSHTGVLIYLN